MKLITLPITIALSLIVATAASADEIARIFAGGPSVAKLLNDRKDEIKAKTGVTIEVRISDAREASRFLAENKIDGISSASSLEMTIGFVDKAALKDQTVNDFQAFEFNRAPVFIGFHPDMGTKTLTEAQLRDIFGGKTRSWEGINGKKSPLKIIHLKATIGAIREISKRFNDSKPLTNTEEVTEKDAILRRMQQDPGLIGLFTVKDTIPSFAPTYMNTDISYPILYIARKTGSPTGAKVFEYLKNNPGKK